VQRPADADRVEAESPMTFNVQHLLHRMVELRGSSAINRYLVACSGGLDSTVLLHSLASVRDSLGLPLVAVHVNHGLHADAPAWEAHCSAGARHLDIQFLSRKVVIAADDKRGPEAAARAARYAAISEMMQPFDCVLSAHHEDDQAETLLLNLLRGSGPGGLAGIGAFQTFSSGWLMRPMLDVSRRAIEHYAREHGLDWIDDPSNAQSRFDRNFLRREVIPMLLKRWPAAVPRLAHSARLAAEAHALQRELADIDLLSCGSFSRIDCVALRRLSPERQRNVLHRAIELAGLPAAPSKRLFEVVRSMLPARDDSEPLIAWPGAELRRYRDTLYLSAPLPTSLPESQQVLQADGRPVDLGSGYGTLRLVTEPEGGLSADCVGAGLQVRFRAGGERLRPHGRRETQQLKKLLQSAGIPPWMRGQLPLLYAGDALVAVADLWIADDAWSKPGFAVRWEGGPPAYALFAGGRSANL
jgi:tRNA(Ile)-lysidine synthase